jgi:hypothetical protein
MVFTREIIEMFFGILADEDQTAVVVNLVHVV